MLWDLYCRVIDNHGDVGVCWRLAADLAARGNTVRLWIDDASALAWLAPDGAHGVSVHDWPGNGTIIDEPGEVVIEAFGCELPPAVLQRMSAVRPTPVWINLEYLSAEDYVERSHRLPSPQRSGLRKWFYYPGFTARTGGLIRERDLLERRRAFDPTSWLAARGLRPRAGERVVSLFCYEQPALDALLDELAQQPTLLLATFGHAARQVQALLGASLARGALRAVTLPALSQTDYDRLLWSCDLNFVRGEDSFVRAQWAGQPFLWQIYPQHDAAHRAKLDAFLDRFLQAAEPSWAETLRRCWLDWNDPIRPSSGLPDLERWREHLAVWRAGLLAQPDLASQLAAFVAESR
jgi:uncharacterized repeat protein (TIGR03837 family)